jgi:RNA polymerase sigma-70 factor (ECF subfamily)
MPRFKLLHEPEERGMNIASHPSPSASAEQCAECARRRGCADCFEELVRRFQTPLLNYLIRRTGNRQDAEDILQETFLRAYRHLRSYRSQWKFSTWIFTIAYRLAVSAKRRMRLAGGEPALEQSCGDDPQALAQENELRGNLWQSARRVLEADAFTALWLSYAESMSAGEIGSVLGKTDNAVRIMMHRARLRLGQELGAEYEPK